jgi:hypothetical protein
MKKLFLLLLLHAWATASFAQFSASVPAVDEAYAPPTRWQQHADSIFQHIDRSQVATGLLVNYGFALKDYHPFQGTALTAAA